MFFPGISNTINGVGCKLPTFELVSSWKVMITSCDGVLLHLVKGNLENVRQLIHFACVDVTNPFGYSVLPDVFARSPSMNFIWG